ncbi:hypothetical protein VTK26DRAFT_6750 [Humicola hyalothermophila]
MGSVPRFFVVRPEERQTSEGTTETVPGPIVPLIAIDELPEWLDVGGIPRELTVEQTVGLYNLGTVPRGNGTYSINIIRRAASLAAGNANTAGTEIKDRTSSNWVAALPMHPTDRTRSHRAGETHAARDPATTITTTGNAVPSPNSASPSPQGSAASSTPPSSSSSKTTAEQQFIAPVPNPNNNNTNSNSNTAAKTTDAAVAAATAAVAADAAAPQPAEYCRHWCRHGTCKWGLRCRYRHELPATAEGLAEVGLLPPPPREWWARWRRAAGLLLEDGNGVGIGQGARVGVGGSGSGSGSGAGESGSETTGGHGSGSGGNGGRKGGGGREEMLVPVNGGGGAADRSRNGKVDETVEARVRGAVRFLREVEGSGLGLDVALGLGKGKEKKGKGKGKAGRAAKERPPLARGKGSGAKGEKVNGTGNRGRTEGKRVMEAGAVAASPPAAGGGVAVESEPDRASVAAAQIGEKRVDEGKKEGALQGTVGSCHKVGKLVDV